MTTAIIGIGNIGGTLARHLVRGGEAVVLAAKHEANAAALAQELGEHARAGSVEEAIAEADAVVFAVWLDTIKELTAKDAALLEAKVVVDPSNPIGVDENGEMTRTLPDDQSAGSVVAAMLPAGAHYVKAFGTLGADSLASAANREPLRAVLFYATDDDDAAKTIERLIRAAGFDPLKAGGVADARRLEAPGGDLQQFGLNGALPLFDKNVTRIGHEETRRLLLRDDDPARPPNEETFQDHRTLEIGGERIDLAWHGANHSPDNIIIHLPDHDTLMLIDIVNPGWAPVYIANLTEDIPGYIDAPANALAYPWKHFIGGHLGRLGTRDDVTLHQQYMADISESSRKAIDTVDGTRYFVKYGDNMWAAVKGYLDEVTRVAAAPVIEKYTGVLAAADVFTESTTFWVMESIRLDLGYGSQVHP